MRRKKYFNLDQNCFDNLVEVERLIPNNYKLHSNETLSTLCFCASDFQLKFGYSEKATKFEKIFHLKFDATQWRQILCGRFFQMWPSQNIRTLKSCGGLLFKKIIWDLGWFGSLDLFHKLPVILKLELYSGSNVHVVRCARAGLL